MASRELFIEFGIQGTFPELCEIADNVAKLRELIPIDAQYLAGEIQHEIDAALIKLLIGGKDGA